MPPRNAADFFELVKNGLFLERKLLWGLRQFVQQR
jgi:hypothetical protein